MSYEEENTCHRVREHSKRKQQEEEDTCMSYEEENTCHRVREHSKRKQQENIF
jgi:hypothetical protein